MTRVACDALAERLGVRWNTQSMAASLALRLQLCGPLAIEHGAGVIREARLPGRQGRRLWAYLVLNRGRAAGRDELATAIWGDEIPDAWDTSLNALVSRLRAVLRPAAGLRIRGEVGRYVLEVPSDAFVDLERGWRALLRAEFALRQQDYATAGAEALIARGIAGRGFLPGEDGPWIEAQRRALADTLLQATEIAGEVELALGRPADAHRLGRELVGLDPLHESGYRLLMRALAASGNRAQAVRIMEECRQALREQADMTPSAETERLFKQIVGA